MYVCMYPSQNYLQIDLNYKTIEFAVHSTKTGNK